MKLACPECRSRIAAAAADLASQQARCAACGHSFDFAGAFRQITQTRPALPLPPAFQRSRNGKVLRFSWPWLQGPVIYFFLVFALIWNGLLGWFYADTLGHPDRYLLFRLLGPGLHLLIGLGMLYLFPALWLGRTTLVADAERLETRHFPPLPFGHRRLLRGEIAQLFCRQRFRRGLRDRQLYELCAWRRDGFEEVLGIFPNYEQGAYLEQQIEAHFGIANRAVGGEGP